jgi:hypothetical protein
MRRMMLAGAAVGAQSLALSAAYPASLTTEMSGASSFFMPWT